MISVVIPSFNRAATILNAAKSVLNQTYTDIELIIVDDCSSDNTREVITALADKRIRYIQHQKNQGACIARNTGILAAKGNYIAFQDSDDIWRPQKLEQQMKAIKSYSSDVCFCKIERHNYPKAKAKLHPDLLSGTVNYENLLMRSLVSTQTILAKREVLKDFNFDSSIKRLQDYDWTIRAGQKYKFCFIENIGVDVYLQDDSISNSSIEKLCNTYELFTMKYKYLFAQYPRWELLLMKKLLRYKILTGQEYSHLFKRVYELEPSLRNYIKLGLAKTRVPYFYYNFKNKNQ